MTWHLTKLGDLDRDRMGMLAMTRVKDPEAWLPGGLMFDIGGDPGTERFLMRRSDYRAPVRIALDGFVAGPNHEMAG